MVETFRSIVEASLDYSLEGVSDSVVLFMGIVLIALLVVSVFALVVQIILGIRYHKYNRKTNSVDLSGCDIARRLLDQNGLQHIKIKTSGSMLFGNSYSHYFKKIRLRRKTWKKHSVAALAMASQKSCLAILDRENDPDMKTRVRLTPLIYFGPLAFVPLVVIGVLIDVIILQSQNAICTISLTAVGLLLYLISFILSIKVLKTEVKAQNKAYEVLQHNGMATEQELIMLKKLFRLYNIQYVNDMIVALLELVYRVLQIVAYAQSNSTPSSNE